MNSLFGDERREDGKEGDEDDEEDVRSQVEDSSEVNSSTKPSARETESESSTLARQETLMVQRTKLLVLLILTLAACAIGAFTYMFTSNAEQVTFEEKVRAYVIMTNYSSFT
jgi:hypothetical protein